MPAFDVRDQLRGMGGSSLESGASGAEVPVRKREVLRTLSYTEQVSALTPGAGLGSAAAADAAAAVSAGGRRDLADPKVRDKHKGLGYKHFTGPAVIDGMKPEDVHQGAIADCYFMAALASAAQVHPDVLAASLRVHPTTGLCRVRFFQRELDGKYAQIWIQVDTDFPAKSGADEPRYGHSPQKDRRGRELWPSIFEKAYAQWKKGYDKMGEGGSSMDAIEALTGHRARFISLTTSASDRVWTKFQGQAKDGKQIKSATAGTRGKDQADLYKGIRLYPWHAYTVMGTRTDGKKRMVKLRNPWGRSEPGSDKKDDGIFELELADFIKYFGSLNYEK